MLTVDSGRLQWTVVERDANGEAKTAASPVGDSDNKNAVGKKVTSVCNPDSPRHSGPKER